MIHATKNPQPLNKAPGFLRRAAESCFLLRNIIRGNILHNWPGALQVMRLLTIHKMPAGLLVADHPWVTGICPDTGHPVWPENIPFRTPVGTDWAKTGYRPDPDEEIVAKVGRFLAAMVRKSVIMPEIPHGPQRRMPHAINYLHGAVHYNGLSLLFNKFSEAVSCLSDPRFREELKRMIREESRDVTFIFRERHYDPVEFAWFSCFVMSHLPWFANTNGSGRRVMWGNASPYPALNIINGSWLKDIEQLRRTRDVSAIVRTPLEPGLYFKGSYGVEGRDYHFIEKMHAYLINNWVRKRGFNAGLYFVDRKKIEPQRYAEYIAAGKEAEPVNAPVPNPVKRKGESMLRSGRG
jgi:hypothetical protein